MRAEDMQAFLAFVGAQHQKHLQAAEADPYAYDPGNTENLEHFDGEYDAATGNVTLWAEIKGMRYENRSRHLEKVAVGDAVELRRDQMNPYNQNNFELFTANGKTLGTLSAELCNCLAPLCDAGAAVIEDVRASYIEQFSERSRYVKQGVLFVKLSIRLEQSAG